MNVGLDRNSRFLIALKISIDIVRMAAIDIAIKNHVLFLKNPKAAPVLVTNVRCRMSLIIGMDSPTVSLRRMIVFEYWSMARIARIKNREISA